MPNALTSSQCWPQPLLLGTLMIEGSACLSDSGTAANLPNPAPCSPYNVSYPQHNTFQPSSRLSSLSYYNVGKLLVSYIYLQGKNPFLLQRKRKVRGKVRWQPYKDSKLIFPKRNPEKKNLLGEIFNLQGRETPLITLSVIVKWEFSLE